MNYKEIVLWERELVDANIKMKHKSKNKSCCFIKFLQMWFKKMKPEPRTQSF